jgi:hypothetical protein
MTLRQIQSAVRSLKAGERIELYRWLDYEMAVDFCSEDCCSRIGVDRAREIRDRPVRIVQDLVGKTSDAFSAVDPVRPRHQQIA